MLYMNHRNMVSSTANWGLEKKKLELQLVLWASSCLILLVVVNDLVGEWLSLASHTDVLRGSSPVPAPQTSAEPKDKFLSHCLQKYQLVITWRLSEIQSALLESKCWQAKHIPTSSVECDTWPKIFAAGENLGDKRWFLYISLCKGWIRCHLLIKSLFGWCNSGVTL